MAKMLRVALVSMKHAAGDVAYNLERHRMWLARALDAGARFIGFPEFALTGWVYEREQTLSLNAAPLREVEGWARRHRVYLATGLVEKRAGRLHNTVFIAGPRGRIGVMRKVNLIRAESVHYTPGRQFPVFRVAGCTMAVATCADASHQEMMLIPSYRGAEVIFAPHANSLGVYGNNAAGWLKWRLENWPQFARSCCVYILGINDAGLSEGSQPAAGEAAEEATKYCGGGAIFDFKGRVAAVAPAGATKQECMIVSDLDLEAVRQAREERLGDSQLRVAIVYNRRSGWKYGRN